MPKYIDADALLTDEMTHTLPVGCGRASGIVVVFVDDIEKAQTADVVPRAEVKEQQSEIAILKDSNINLQELYYTEREKVKKAKQKVIDIAKALQTARAEAIKDFAERLQAKAQFSEDFGDAAVSYEDIENLIKEMTEEHYETQ